MKAYYNENDKKTEAWLRELIKEGLIADGDVDDRSIEEVTAKDVVGYTQCHFFAGIGGWSYALRLAGWPDDRPVWTGSCPCQPFSVAGKRKGTEDKRHLWPEFARLIRECKPATVFGEQVASKDGREWLSGVFADLEEMGYRRAGADLCAAGVGAPHIRQRLYWMADSKSWRQQPQQMFESAGIQLEDDGEKKTILATCGYGTGICCRMGNPTGDRWDARRTEPGRPERITETSVNGRFGDMHNDGSQGRSDGIGEYSCQLSPWSSSSWIECKDGKARRIPLKSILFPLAHGVPNRVGTLRGAGNAIVPQAAAEFIRAAMEVMDE
jgi:DNA (cytosine-5)-methyltransferase 1